jgi:type VI protein secretion system component Hcp
MASNIVLKLANIEGESAMEGDYANWIECNSLSFGCSAPISVKGNQGLASGQAQLSDYNLSLHLGAHTAELITKMLNGTHHSQVDIHVLKRTGEDDLKPYYTIKGEKAYISSISISAGPDGELYESLSIAPEKHTWEYSKQNTDDGTLSATGAKEYDVKSAKTA